MIPEAQYRARKQAADRVTSSQLIKNNPGESKDLRARLEAINRRIAAACGRAGRQVSEITLVAASKTVPAARIREAIEAGVRTLGESRIQEADAKIHELSAISAERKVQWHLI